MTTARLRALTIRTPLEATVKVQLPDGRSVPVVGFEMQTIALNDEAITEWPVALVLITAPEEPQS